MLITSSATNEISGSRTLRSQTLASTTAAMMMAIQNRIVFAGSEAFTSV